MVEQQMWFTKTKEKRNIKFMPCFILRCLRIEHKFNLKKLKIKVLVVFDKRDALLNLALQVADHLVVVGLLALAEVAEAMDLLDTVGSESHGRGEEFNLGGDGGLDKAALNDILLAGGCLEEALRKSGASVRH